ncbi:endonuclease Q family protein [Sporomusa termitida]|uniref:TIGR00375: family protein n=1 Tax=Sporomusa termitida TaxID=2377 RepID=A0A517DU19_9FIRM|nr:endonuclease Q family protein [Sporomusa termitida]QDR80786.1 TIGR00375: family protein [Sporomusa termitida]
MLKQYFADLHIHVGMSESGKWVKIPTSRQLTVRGILSEATDRKGMNIIGIVDALSPLVLADIKKLTAEGLLVPVPNGGYLYKEKTLLLLGAEIETREEGGGLAHTLVFIPDLPTMAAFSAYMSQFIRNISLSSQNAHMPLQKLIAIAGSFDALIIPAHVFTPHKSVYGACCTRLSQILSEQELSRLAAIELGLSADSDLADRIGELAGYTFITNSDAHSLDKIAREYNIFSLLELSFREVAQALARTAGRQVRANYGLNPRLGKYHRTFCPVCGFIATSGGDGDGTCCPECNSPRLITGVYDRINHIANYLKPQHPLHRPDYFYQVPLEFIPGLGKKIKDRLLAEFKTEMAIVHTAGRAELNQIAGTKITAFIMRARAGTAAIAAGGGGIYGRLAKT